MYPVYSQGGDTISVKPIIGMDNNVGRALALWDRDWLTERLAHAVRPPAEYCFANLYLFRNRHRYRLVDGPVAHLSGVTYDGLRHALPLTRIDLATADVLLATHDCIFPLGMEAIALADALGLVCRSEDADSDYVFDTARLAKLENAKARRAQARHFEAEHSPVFGSIRPDLAAELGQVLEGWFVDVRRDADATDLLECREAITMIGPLELQGAIVHTGNGKPVAFLLASRRNDGEHIVHFAKGLRATDGAFPWMFARYAEQSGAKFLNFEQDLGNPGFAQSKRSYAPIDRRAKFRLCLA